LSSNGDWEGQGKHLYFNDQHKKLIEEKKQHLKDNYDGIGDFFLQKLREEEVLSPEEKLKQIEKREKEIKDKKNQLKLVISNR